MDTQEYIAVFKRTTGYSYAVVKPAYTIAEHARNQLTGTYLSQLKRELQSLENPSDKHPRELVYNTVPEQYDGKLNSQPLNQQELSELYSHLNI